MSEILRQRRQSCDNKGEIRLRNTRRRNKINYFAFRITTISVT